MKLPSLIRVIGKPYSVELVPKTKLETADLGECKYPEQQITIQSGQAKEQEQDTLLHEVIHAVDEAMDTDLSETQVRRMATGLLAVFHDNPDFVKYLMRVNVKK